MQQRIKIQQTLPAVWQATYALAGSLANIGIPPKQKHLISIRASQLNGCAFCLDMHSKEALQDGESLQRIVLLDAWRDSGLFSEEEQAILAITEEVTLVHRQGVSDATYARGLELFGEETLAGIIMSAVAINTWNRIAISTQLPVPKQREAAQPA